MNKKGQFFLIAAVIIVGVVITLAAINISTTTPKEDATIYDLSKEINYESNQLIDKGVYLNEDSEYKILSLARNYSNANPDTDMLIIFGNQNEISGVEFKNNPSGFTGVSASGSPIGDLQFTKTETQFTPEKQGNLVTILLEDQSDITFELSQGESFYIVLQREVGEERLVAQE